jgi:hypothetical protein
VKTYWDTSAAINALVSPTVFNRLAHGEHFARVHLLSEFFSTMTGRGIEVKDQQGQPARLILAAEDAARWLRTFGSKVVFVEVSADELLDGLDRAGQEGVQGGRVYDFAHALAANKTQADELLTRNAADFSGLTTARLEWP